jgi:hypothetical protein
MIHQGRLFNVFVSRVNVFVSRAIGIANSKFDGHAALDRGGHRHPRDVHR